MKHPADGRTRGLSVPLSVTGCCLLLVWCAVDAGVQAQEPPQRSYYVYACAESEDEVAVVRFGPQGLEVVKTIAVGSFPTENEGAHGINISPDGKYWYVSLAHGMPFGTVHKYETGSDMWIGDVTLGMFPATLDISASTGLLYVVNFNLHGPMEPSSISIVETATMIEIERVPTGTMPHGSRLNREGSRHYSVNMMDDELVELDSLEFKVSRKLSLSTADATTHDGHGPAVPPDAAHAHQRLVQPTWVTRPTPQGKVYIAGNNADVLFEVDLKEWRVTRRYDNAGKGPYNVEATPDGKTLLTTYKKGASVGFWDTASGRELARVRTSRTIPHGIAITPDGEFAFVTLEGVGGEPGTVEVYHVAGQTRVGAVDIGKQAGGIAFWKTEP